MIPRILILDANDSYTRNLLDLIHHLDPETSPVQVQRRVIILSTHQIDWLSLSTQIIPHFAAIILGPGPGSPSQQPSSDLHPTQCFSKILSPHTLPSLCRGHHLPVLGICLGHQALAHAFGATIIPAPSLAHGQTSSLILSPPPPASNKIPNLFELIPPNLSPTRVVRYNSLTIDPLSFPSQHLHITAWSQDDPHHRSIMAIAHNSLPFHSLQFHPESICSSHGSFIIQSFLNIISNSSYLNDPISGLSPTVAYSPLPDHILRLHQLARIPPTIPSTPLSSSYSFQLRTSILFNPPHPYLTPQPIFQHFIKPISPLGSIWLDSADASHPSSTLHTRLSHLGSVDILLSYFAHHRSLTVRSDSSQEERLEKTLDRSTTFWDWLKSIQVELQNRTDVLPSIVIDSTPANNPPSIDLNSTRAPVGFMGYINYELLSESLKEYNLASRSLDSIPDVEFGFCNTALSFDHASSTWIASALVSIGPSSSHHHAHPSHPDSLEDHLFRRFGLSENEYQLWIESIKTILSIDPSPTTDSSIQPQADLPNGHHHHHHHHHPAPTIDHHPSCYLHPIVSQADYLQAISSAQDIIRSGQAYELCLTTQFQGHLQRSSDDPDHLIRYLQLRQRNPAPYAAYIHFKPHDTLLLSSSPERFMSIDHQSKVEMKPIKGTARRDLNDPAHDLVISERLRNDPKERAENLMITDLIRHDLHGFCEPGSVEVTELFQVESILSVHSLVSTVVGHLRSDLNPIDALRIAFPPGSMTGAPKVSSIEILDRLELGRARGVYSGILGFISVDGRTDMSVIIRTAIIRGSQISIGGGGAITCLSNKEDEWKEMKLKIESVQKNLNLL